MKGNFNLCKINSFLVSISFPLLDERSVSWKIPSMFREWTDLNDSGMYLGLDFGTNVKIYKKDLEPGLHKIDDTSAFYLFEYKG